MNWWELVEVGETEIIVPAVEYRIRCASCGEPFVTSSLMNMPDKCPVCFAETSKESVLKEVK